MTSRRATYPIAAWIAAALCGPPALADEAEPVVAPGEVIEVFGQRPVGDGPDGPDAAHADAERALAEPAFVTVVRVDDRAGETAAVAEVLAESAGVSVRSLGGLGGFASISVRGAAPGHTALAIDGVPLSTIAYAGKDLSLYELDSFSQLELYRGGVPAERGGAALGGALNFVTAVGPDARGRRLRLSLGGGSFGARHLRARWRDAADDGALAYHVALGYRGADGDYSYFNDNGTPLEPSDDAFVDRTNNGFDRFDAVARARWQTGSLVVSGGTRGSFKAQGIPGRDAIQTEQASLDTFSQLADARLDAAAGAWHLGAGGYALFERQTFVDRLGEVGIGVDDHRTTTWVGGTSISAARPLGGHQRLTAAVEARTELFRDADRMNPADGVRGQRATAAVALSDEVALVDHRVVIAPGVRLDAMRTDPGTGWDPIVVDADALGVRHDVYASPRIAARALVHEAVVLKGSAGRYFRAPTLVELFGDRGLFVGDPTLEPETGESADLGAVYAPARAYGPVDRIYLHAAGFASRPNDAIVFVPNASGVAVAHNVGDAVIWGAEAAAAVRWYQRFTLAANYTLLDSRQHHPQESYDGRQLPGRPGHQAYARADLALRPLGRLLVAWADAQLTAGNFLDAANLNRVPGRALFGGGVKLAPHDALLVSLEIKNLTDARVETIALDPAPRPDLTEIPRAVSDFLGYPLPGRAFYLTLDWTY